MADEVGLGKTLVARGLIAKTIDHLWDKRKRIDVVYVCSNAEIARQNLTKLNVCKNCGITQATGLTQLAITLRQLNEQRVNFVSFTPDTAAIALCVMRCAPPRSRLSLVRLPPAEQWLSGLYRAR